MVMENKLGIVDALELAKAEERITKKKAMDLYYNGKILKKMVPGSFRALREIHRYMFDELYPFAGQLRTVNVVKGSVHFVDASKLEQTLDMIDEMPTDSFDEIMDKYVAMFLTHPFRDGNGRASRIWLDQLVRKELHRTVAWSLIDKDDYVYAMDESPVSSKTIRQLLRNALTRDIRDRQLLMNSIDYSFSYEGYHFYRCSELK